MIPLPSSIDFVFCLVLIRDHIMPGKRMPSVEINMSSKPKPKKQKQAKHEQKNTDRTLMKLNIDDIPVDLILLAFEGLSLQDMILVRQVSRMWASSGRTTMHKRFEKKLMHLCNCNIFISYVAIQSDQLDAQAQIARFGLGVQRVEEKLATQKTDEDSGVESWQLLGPLASIKQYQRNCDSCESTFHARFDFFDDVGVEEWYDPDIENLHNFMLWAVALVSPLIERVISSVTVFNEEREDQWFHKVQAICYIKTIPCGWLGVIHSWEHKTCDPYAREY